MRVYISYSFHDEELYLLSLLINKLQEQGHIVETPDTFSNRNEYNIERCDLFIGLVTEESDSSGFFEEWQLAMENGKESIILVEDGIMINRSVGQFISFNRENPDAAIDQLMGMYSTPTKKKTSSGTEDVIAIAAIIIGIAAVIALLSGSKKK